MMVGSYFYLYTKRDFEVVSAKELFYKRKHAKLCKQKGFDVEKVAFLENYISELEKQIGVLQYEETKI